jgi:hypothetical protein
MQPRKRATVGDDGEEGERGEAAEEGAAGEIPWRGVFVISAFSVSLLSASDEDANMPIPNPKRPLPDNR